MKSKGQDESSNVTFLPDTKKIQVFKKSVDNRIKRKKQSQKKIEFEAV